MRLLLDAHISGRVIGKALADKGYDARALDSEAELEGIPDTEVLELAVTEQRILVSANVQDFAPLLAQWATEGRTHSGMILVPPSVRNEAFGVLISGLEQLLSEVGEDDWNDRVEWLQKG